VLNEQWCLIFGPIPSATQVSRLRLDPNEIPEAIHGVRAEVAARGHRSALWNVGASSSPSDLVDRLVAHGLVAEDHLTALVLTQEPPVSSPDIEARRIRDITEFKVARQITDDVFEVPEDRRREWSDTLEERFEGERSGAGARVYLAYIDGQAVGTASSIVEDDIPAALMLGGATLASARGRGVYRALIRARWDDAVESGIAALTVQARATSRPILERLGFEHAGEIEVLLDPATC
jgi:GNAT superfamily N-acetyltransferase